jgi:tetratricopeptide (TPR) repeat protein
MNGDETPVDHRSEQAAERLLEQTLADPRKASGAAALSLSQARARRDGAGQAIALRVLGVAAHSLNDAVAAAGHLRASIRVSQRFGETTLEAEARMSYALVLDDLGYPAKALREVDRACQTLTGLRLGRATMQRALILRRIGRDTDALAGYQRALSTFRRYGDASWQARALVNRGVLHGYRGELAQARIDLLEAEQIFVQLDLTMALAKTRHNIGYIAGLGGDVTTALEYYDRAREQLSDIGANAATEQNRAELLLTARLLPEARLAVAEAITAARAGRLTSLLGQAQLLSARIELVGGATTEARALAARARSTFIRQGRTSWAALARRVEIGARVAAGGHDRRTMRALEQAGDELAAAEWMLRAWDAWIDAAHLAVELGDPVAVERLLGKASAARTAGPAQMRARIWHCSALLALRAGSRTVAKRHAAAGYREIERHQASLGATELGIRGGAAGVEIAAVRLRLSLQENDAVGALLWLQRVRGVALRLPPARPSDDPVVVDRLAELRTITADIATTAADSVHGQRLMRRQRAVEAEVRQRSWRTTGHAARPRTHQPKIADLALALGSDVLVELFALDGALHALVLRDGRVHHRRLCTVEEAGSELAALRFAVRRHVVYSADTAVAGRALGALRYAAEELERMLLAPIADLVGDRPMVIAPTDVLHALPWSMLPLCHGRPVSVTPSSWLWWQAHQASPRTGDTVLIAGPAPEHAATEVAALHRQLPGAIVLTGADATVGNALAALDGAALGHVASHGVFRVDNPLFSHMTLADGPLTVCDLSALRHPPGLLILSACDAGLSAVHPGDELQGVAIALLGLGARTLIASLGLVDDTTTRRLMTDLHERLEAGASPAAALAAAQAAARSDDAVSAANFVCMGVG